MQSFFLTIFIDSLLKLSVVFFYYSNTLICNSISHWNTTKSYHRDSCILFKFNRHLLLILPSDHEASLSFFLILHLLYTLIFYQILVFLFYQFSCVIISLAKLYLILINYLVDSKLYVLSHKDFKYFSASLN